MDNILDTEDILNWEGRPSDTARMRAIEAARREVSEAVGGDLDISARGLLWWVHPPLGLLGTTAFAYLTLTRESLGVRVALALFVIAAITIAWYGILQERTAGLRTQLWFTAVSDASHARAAEKAAARWDRYLADPFRWLRVSARIRRVVAKRAAEEKLPA